MIDVALIKELLASDITSYQISKKTGIHTQVIDRYRNGQSKLENMTLKNGQKLSDLAKVALQNENPSKR